MSKFKLAAALALLAGPMAIEAAPITVDFTLASTASSSPNYASGVLGSGFFTCDDALTPANGSVGNSILG